ncbi:MAG: cytochrome c [Melioribacteraceae bacterium]|nr:cytochrome c [Melioribacteraceae bacterium]
MTNAQKWVSTFLLLFILLLVLAKMTSSEEDELVITENIESTEDQSPEKYAEELMANNKCFTCHGKNLEGARMGPSLANVKENWEKGDLVSYFKNPKAFLSNPRMAVLKDKYSKEMPAQDKLSHKELDALAEYLLHR